MSFPILETNRIILREMTNDDVQVVFDFNSCAESLKYIVREPFKTLDEAREKLSFFVNGNREKNAFWWVFRLKETGEDIGYGGVFDVSADHKRAEIGYGLIKKYWRQKYMSEIIEAMIQFAINELNLHKITAVVIPGNEASLKLLSKNNFIEEAHFKQHSFARGTYFDEKVFSLIR